MNEAETREASKESSIGKYLSPLVAAFVGFGLTFIPAILFDRPTIHRVNHTEEFTRRATQEKLEEQNSWKDGAPRFYRRVRSGQIVLDEEWSSWTGKYGCDAVGSKLHRDNDELEEDEISGLPKFGRYLEVYDRRERND